MPTCREMCPIAKPQKERKEEKSNYSDGDPYVMISAVAYGVTVTALENDEFPGVISTQVPQDAKPTCSLAIHITEMMHTQGTSGVHARCDYVPSGIAWVSVTNNSSQEQLSIRHP